MREIFLDDSPSHETNTPEAGRALSFKRREFLQTLGIVGAGLVLAPKAVFAQSSEAGLWRDRVNGFVYTVCNDSRAQAISSQLARATIYDAPRPTDFHTRYSAPFIFWTVISPEEVICGNGFQVDRFPFYDVQCPCRGVNDLNAFEIRAVTHPKEMERFDCVLAPHGRRTSLEDSDHADYTRTAREYGVNPDHTTVEYKRPVVGKGRVRRAYHVTDNTRVDSTTGKRFRDVFISSSDI